MSAQASLPPVWSATSGGLGAAASNAIIYPLDLITSRLQTQRKGRYNSLPDALNQIVKNEGVFALYAGLESDTVSTLFSNFIYFYCYQALHKALSRHKSGSSVDPKTPTKPVLFTAPEELAIGMVAGVISRAFVTPLSNVTVRKQTSATSVSKDKESAAVGEDNDDDEGDFGNGPSSMAIAREIVDEKGWTGLWSGFKSACILTINPSISMYGFELLKHVALPKAHREKPTAVEVFLCSSFASVMASMITYPLILAKTRQQWRSPSGKYPYKSMMDVITKTVQKEGPSGLYAGLQGRRFFDLIFLAHIGNGKSFPELTKAFFQLGLSMTIKSRVELLIMALYRWSVHRRKQLA